MIRNSSATISAPKRASARRRAALPPSAKASMRMCRLRATAAEPATSASTIIRKTEISSVHANDWLVR
jgi:hypothetical protein